MIKQLKFELKLSNSTSRKETLRRKCEATEKRVKRVKLNIILKKI